MEDLAQLRTIVRCFVSRRIDSAKFTLPRLPGGKFIARS